MFSGLKKRVSSVLQEGRQLSENLSNAYTTTRSSHTTSNNDGSQSSMNAVASSAAALVKDLGTSIIGHTSGTLSTKPSGCQTSAKFPHDVLNAQAGFAYLAEQERIRNEMRCSQALSAETAERIDAELQAIHETSERNLVSSSDMSHSLQCLPAIHAQLSECNLMMIDVVKDCARIEEALFELEDITEELELHERKLQLTIELARYRDRKMVELEAVRKEMAQQYAERQRQNELRLLSVQQERQAVFAEAFQDDLKCYRAMGTIPKVDTVARSSDPETLEEIVLDAGVDEKRTLDDFLNN